MSPISACPNRFPRLPDLLFNTAMANTNRCNPNAMNPADRRRGCRGKGIVKEGVPPPLPGAVPEPTQP